MNNTVTPDTRSANALWASVLVETIVRGGARHVVISPGSRSTPLTIAFARHPEINAVPVLDERSAGFYALGLAKADGRPAVLLCTSGTAAANYLPAIVEAHESGVPLLVITADRPPEMRACASGQTIDQQKLYGSYVGFFHELAVPELEVGRLRYLRQTIVHALQRTLVPARGVVHLNVPFRDPLAPLPDGGVAEAFARSIDWAQFFGQVAPVPAAADSAAFRSSASVAQLASHLSPEAHGLIIVGPNQPVNADGFVEGVSALATRLGWPVLADGLTPLRGQASRVPALVTTYDLILRNRASVEQLRPEVVLCVGGWPTSKVLRAWLETNDAATWLVTDRIDNRDALHGRTRQVSVSLSDLAQQLPQSDAPSSFTQRWLRSEAAVRSTLDRCLHEASDLIEPKVAWLLAQHLPEQTPVFIANSMPIRDVEYVWPPGDRRIQPWCNRGANGIDGTLSTALGVMEATGRPGVLLTGDLALLHDTNGFLLGPKTRASLTIVLINNGGGGIFEHLPIASFEPPFEQYFATPQAVEFVSLCAAYGIEHIAVENWGQFVASISELPSSGLRVLELRTDRKRDAAWRKQQFANLAAGVL
jgi:2-succinyl-5-enolpyruvyl-6-hydroxy-3-cyclohexene-1-carboxylate synthase